MNGSASYRQGCASDACQYAHLIGGSEHKSVETQGEPRDNQYSGDSDRSCFGNRKQRLLRYYRQNTVMAAQVDNKQETQNAEIGAATQRCSVLDGFARQHCLMGARVRYNMN